MKPSTGTRRWHPIIAITTLLGLLLQVPLGYAQDAETAVEESSETKQTRPRASSQGFLAKARPDQSLTLGDTHKLHALYLGEQKGSSAGGLIIVSGARNPSTHKELELLRNTLPLHGWHTLALYFPIELSSPHPERSLPVKAKLADLPGRVSEPTTAAEADATEDPAAAEEPALESSETAEADKPELTNSERINLAVKYLNDARVEAVVVVAAGVSASEVANQFREQPPRGIRALILVDPDSANNEIDLAAAVRASSLPILDLYRRGENTEKAALERKIAARFKPSGSYTQLAILPSSGIQRGGGEDRLSRRVRGWLEKRSTR